ncbi:MAG TPA: hypothetical protein VFP61_08375 [Acidimicrobiales bacterium]|nr:hypothetical protein [Acidimicrobiales bacterium]
MTGTHHPRTVAALGVVAAAMLAAGCASVEALPSPVPPPTPPTATTVAPLPDLTGVAPVTVDGRTTTTAPVVGPGAATIAGTVTGPNGPVGGATVELTRVVGRQTATTDATTAPDGTFTVPKLLGGAYRVRAWQAPVLALTDPQVFFMGDTETKRLSLQLTAYTGTTVTASTAPPVVAQGGYVDVVVSVQAQVVGADGVVRPSPVTGQPVEIDGGGGWLPTGADPAVTDGGGVAQLVVQCALVGAPPLVITAPGAQPITAGDSTCVPAATPAPTTTTTTTTLLPSSTSSTDTTSTTAAGGF